MILALKTDQPEASVELYDPKSHVRIASKTWLAGRELSSTLNQQIEQLLQHNKLSFGQLTGIVVFSGPGSFTGLRIGASAANTFSYILNIPIVGSKGNDWQQTGTQALLSGQNDHVVQLEYGAEPNITKPRK